MSEGTTLDVTFPKETYIKALRSEVRSAFR